MNFKKWRIILDNSVLSYIYLHSLLVVIVSAANVNKKVSRLRKLRCR